MSVYTQTGRAMSLTTPLGKDVLLLVGFTGREAISKLFSFQLDLLAVNDAPVAFEKLLGQKVSVELSMPADRKRYFSGIAWRVSQGKRDETFTSFRIEMAPKFWLLTKKVQSRIFQRISVPDILKQVLAGLDVAFELQGVFHPRDFCVQYRESDFAFASRLMEEEGIYYYFTHDADGHKMIVANTPQSHRPVPTQPQIVYDEVTGGTRKDMRITDWEKTQELRSGKVTLWDHCFELPDQSLQAEKIVQDTVAIGKVTHKLNVADNVKLEIYDYPGAFAQRFDGVDRGGGDNGGDLKKIFEDNVRTAEIRMQQEALPGLVIQGASDCRHFVSGHKFALQRHFNADGDYVLTSVDHFAQLSGDYRSGQSGEFSYENHFQCIPLALPFRPPSATPKPTIHGTQTAVVTGVPGEEIFCDKYGRVKVQFYWDRQGKKNADSSCWIRVGQTATGKGFGALNLPRIGHEVIVAFLEGDPDQPIVVGSVYNADNMPPYALPRFRNYSGMRHESVGGVLGNSSEIRFETGLGVERLLMHAETDMHQHAESDSHLRVGNDHTAIIANDHELRVGHSQLHNVGHNYTINVGSPVSRDVPGASGSGQPVAAGSGAGGGDAAPPPDASIDAKPDTSAFNGEDFNPFSSQGGDYFQSSAPQEAGIGTFQITAPNLLTITKIMDNKLATGLESLLVLGVNTQIVVGANLQISAPLNAQITHGTCMETIFGKKIEVTVPEKIDVAAAHTTAIAGLLTKVSTLGMSLSTAASDIMLTNGTINLDCALGSAILKMSPAGIVLTCGASTLSVTPSGITASPMIQMV